LTRPQRLAVWTLGSTVVLVAIGGFTRGSGSGYGCADRWPLCEDGLLGGLLPRADFHMIVEWTHRWVAAIVTILLVLLVVSIWRRHRAHRGLLAGAVAALVVILFQAGLGAAVVITHLEARELVATHLMVAMVVLGLLAFTTVEAFYSGDGPPATSTAPDATWRRAVAAGAGGTLVVILFGAIVHDQYVGGWPLVGGVLLPELMTTVVAIHFLHRVAALAVFALLVWLAVAAVRRSRPRAEVRLVHLATSLFAVNIGLGAAHVFTRVESVTLVVVHLLVATLTWVALVLAASVARRADMAAAPADPPPVSPRLDTAGVAP
jgi:heme a synthase